ncbi:MAG: sensor histidine kinase KdpD [Rhodospirillaceae bacterium]|nr:sensor histidine kinase KdpD [Rhodospirillaceae bacterium]
MQDNNRPSPDALLAAAQRENRGRLKVFLGAAPGVGKTYAMLQAGHRAKTDGIDVVIGVVETHSRADTEALVAGLEAVPPRIVPYKGRNLAEMDLDAILARRPKLALVDELAHTNAQGSRHPKRYLDIEELRDAGIDVYTTVNVQHIESLNDIVAQITRIRVRETVPDSVIANATDIELIDLSPGELIKRLHEGKVYVRDQAQRALKHYFSPGNLTALRELALRRTAQRVDAQMVDYMQTHAIQGPWAAGERVLVCIGDPAQSEDVVRYGKRIADHLKGPWSALYVQTAKHLRLNDRQRKTIDDGLRMAEHLGGETATIIGSDIVKEVLSFARENNFTHIVLGKAQRSRLVEIIKGSVVHELVRHARGITIHVLPGSEKEAPASSPTEPAQKPILNAAHYLISTLGAVAALGLGLVIDRAVAPTNVSFVFLAAVLFSAATYGLGPALWSAVLCMLLYNFFFLEPLYTLTISDPANVVALVFFGLAAVLTSTLAGQTREQAEVARREGRISSELYKFSRKLTEINVLEDLLTATAHQIYAMLKLEAVLLMESGDRLEVRAAWPPEDKLDDADMAAAQWCWQRKQVAGRGSDTLPGAKRLFMPLETVRGPVGVLGLHRPGATGSVLSSEDGRLLDALVDLAALTLERVRMADDLEGARVLKESERFRMALLSSVSHDLKTPLASIIGTVSGLKHYGAMYDDATRDEMLATALQQAERLNRYVANLLDITKLDSGALEPKVEATDLDDIVNGALKRNERELNQHRIKAALADDLPLVLADPVLLETALANILENAAKHTPAGSTVTITTRRDGQDCVIDVSDEGPGIPDDQLLAVFDKFHRIARADRQSSGTGLGLSITKGFIEAMGGRVSVANRKDRTGAVFSLSIPCAPHAEPALEK